MAIMKRPILLLLVLICFFSYALQIDKFKPLNALAGGTWQMKTKKGFICERWTKANTNELRSIGFKVIGADTVIEERVRVIKKDNDIYYVPTVTGQNSGKEVFFKLTSTTNGEYIFTNPEHDFPQRVVYQLIAPDSLHAWVDGQYNGKYVKQDFHYKRVNN
jgi:hypothetical protein